MTEQMAIEHTRQFIKYLNYENWEKDFDAIEILINATEEIQQYRAIDTIENLQDLKEKSVAKKPRFVDTRFRNLGRHISDGCSLDKCYECPTCRSHIFHVWESEKYCNHCGQYLDWE